MTGLVTILTTDLPYADSVIDALSKRPTEIYIVGHVNASGPAMFIKQALPGERIALHATIGAKALLIAPETVWIMGSDFGAKNRLEFGVGFHSHQLYEITWSELFERAWGEAREIGS